MFFWLFFWLNVFFVGCFLVNGFTDGGGFPVFFLLRLSSMIMGEICFKSGISHFLLKRSKTSKKLSFQKSPPTFWPKGRFLKRPSVSFAAQPLPLAPTLPRPRLLPSGSGSKCRTEIDLNGDPGPAARDRLASLKNRRSPYECWKGKMHGKKQAKFRETNPEVLLLTTLNPHSPLEKLWVPLSSGGWGPSGPSIRPCPRVSSALFGLPLGSMTPRMDSTWKSFPECADSWLLGLAERGFLLAMGAKANKNSHKK